MDREVQAIIDNTDFNGYVIVDWDSMFAKTTCPNNAVAIALERTRTGGTGLAEFVKVYSVGTMGKYHHTPGKRYGEEYNWNRALRQLMG
jgi:hypothetical protein